MMNTRRIPFIATLPFVAVLVGSPVTSAADPFVGYNLLQVADPNVAPGALMYLRKTSRDTPIEVVCTASDIGSPAENAPTPEQDWVGEHSAEATLTAKASFLKILVSANAGIDTSNSSAVNLKYRVRTLANPTNESLGALDKPQCQQIAQKFANQQKISGGQKTTQLAFVTNVIESTYEFDITSTADFNAGVTAKLTNGFGAGVSVTLTNKNHIHGKGAKVVTHYLVAQARKIVSAAP